MSNSIRNVAKIKKVNKEITVIILAASESRHMSYYGCRSLIDIPNDKTIIEIQLRALENLKIRDIILVGGYECDKLFNKTPHNIIKVENPNYKDNNVCKSISLGLRAARGNDNILLVPGDVIFNNISSKFNESFVNITQNIKHNEDVGCLINDKYVDNFSYGEENVTNCLSFFTGRELEILTKFAHNRTNNNCLFIEIFNHIINNHGKLKAEYIDSVEIDSLKHIKNLLRLGFII